MKYQVVDVFTRQPLEGNPLAVFPDGRGIGDVTMQRIARELNLSETVFVVPATRPDCVARLRIFTPFSELPFAGHPTVGASFVLIQNGTVPEHTGRFALEEGIGAVPIHVDAGDRPLIWLTTPPIQDGPVFDGAACATVLGLETGDLLDLPPQLLNAGNPTLFIALKNNAAVDRASADMSGMRSLAKHHPGPFCIFVFALSATGAYSRMFAPAYGIAEDPATGSATGPLAAYMIRHKLVSGALGTRFVSEQGTHMGRRSLLHVHVHRDGIDVGGYVTPLIDATMRLE
jgi:trans-2,3-dihydro-3-hydroxyanthranilate isomerase